MGNCGGGGLTAEERAQRDKAQEMDKKIAADKQYDEQLIKLLLLGAGESGKSTIFKQMRILYGEGFGEESRMQTAGVIISNLVGGTRTVLENCEKLGHPLKTDNQLAAAKIVTEQADDTLMTDETAAAIKLLWESQPFQETFKLRSKFQLFDCYGDFAKSLAKKYPAWGGPMWCVVLAVRGRGGGAFVVRH
jgi:guanine nucleotide-binding protein G(i) subunit alpha